MVQSAVALLDRRGHELGDGRAERDRHTGLAGGGGDDAHVLVVQLQAESGVEGAVEHLLPLLVEDLGAGESAAEHLERRGGLDSVGFEEDHGLGQQTDVAGDDELVGGLDRLARARGADEHDRLAHGVEDLGHGVEVGFLAADHDRQHSVDGSRLSAGDRGVERLQALLLGLLGQVRGHIGADGREVDPGGTGRGRGEDALVAEQHVLDVG